MDNKIFIKEITKDIICIDSGYFAKCFAAIYFILQNNKVAIVDTGSNNSINNIKQALHSYNLDFQDVSYIILTHIHLDHAGGASKLMRLCKNAKLVVHPRGAPHMINPNKLIEGVKGVYGEEKFTKLYGDILPIAKHRIIEAEDNFILDFYNRKLIFIDTPGHAKHHFCIWDENSQFMFTGDTFGVSYREFDKNHQICIFPSTTPVQFQPQELLKSIQKIIKYKPKKLCLTHFSAIEANKQALEKLVLAIEFFVDIVKTNASKRDATKIIKNKMLEYLLTDIKDLGFTDLNFAKKKLELDVDINTQGLIFWYDKYL